MAFNAEDTYKLIRLIEQRKKPNMFFANRFFPSILEFDDEEIHFDMLSRNRRLAPFVSPLVAGKVMSDRGHTMKSFRPAYVKPKHVVDPKKATKRRPGEAFGGALSIAQRYDLAKMENFITEAEMIDNRIELMCVEALRTGSIIVAGEDYPTQVVSFGRDAGLTITLSGADLWSAAGTSTPYGDIEDVMTLMAKAAFGAPPKDIVFDPSAWKAFRDHPDTLEKLDKNYAGQNTLLNRGPTAEDDDVTLVGSLNGGATLLWMDSRDYEDSAGNIQPFLSPGDVVFGSPNIEGVRAFGAILDVEYLEGNGRVRGSIFPKYYTTKDPSLGYTLTQSAPLPVPVRQNASAYMKVLA